VGEPKILGEQKVVMTDESFGVSQLWGHAPGLPPSLRRAQT